MFAANGQNNINYNNLRFEHINMNNGLSNNSVTCFLQDTQGFIWIGTGSGLNRFDGYNFKIYQHDPTDSTSISSGAITCMYQDANGFIWIGTSDAGLNKFDPGIEKFTSWVHNDTIKTSIPTNSISTICAGTGYTFWIGTDKGLIQFDYVRKSFKLFQHDEKDSTTISANGINTVFTEVNKLWIGTFGKGINILNISSGKVTRLKTFSPGIIPNNKDYVHEIIKYKDSMLIALTDGGLIGINTFTLHETILVDTIEAQHCIKDNNGWLWIGTRDVGLVLFNPQTNKRINYKGNEFDASAISDNSITSVYQSSDKSIWIGEFLTGFHLTNPSLQNFNIIKAPAIIKDKKFGVNQGNNNYIMSFAEDDNSCLWLGTFNEGLHQFKKQDGEYRFVRNFDNYNTSVTNPFPIVLLKGSGNDLWQGHFGGGEAVVRFNTKTYKVQSLQRFKTDSNNAIAENNCTALLWDSAGILWIGMPRFGLDKYDVKTKSFTHYQHDKNNLKSISGTWVNAIKSKNNILWIGTNGGLSKMNADGSFTNYTHKDNDVFSLGGEDVSCMNFDEQGRLWIGTGSGDLNVFKPAVNKFLHVKLYAGKTKTSVAGLLVDNYGTIWLSTDAGISSFTPPKNLDAYFVRNENVKQSEWDSLFRNYNKTDGLPFTQFNSYSYYKSNDGKLYFGSQRGTIVIDPGKLVYNKQIPKVVFTAFSILNKDVITGDSTGTLKQSVNHSKEIILKPGQSVFSIEFSALNFIASTKNRFAYKLDGFDKNWIVTDYKKRIATYTALRPNRYVFHVRASNNDGVWNETGKSIIIIIKPAWYQTWLFKTALVFLLIALIFFATRYYFHQKIKLQQGQLEKLTAIENIRSKISQDIHDDIGAQLTKISLMSQRIKLNYNTHNNLDENLLNKIAESSQEVVSNLSEIIWTVNPKHDNLQSLLAYIRNYISNFFDHTAVRCTIIFPEEIIAHIISPDLKHNLFLILKESLNNILKHSGATEVSVHFYIDDKSFCFEIKDNGKGITDMKGRAFGNGLMNMKKRMEDVNGQFEIVSEINTGTTITLKGELISS